MLIEDMLIMLLLGSGVFFIGIEQPVGKVLEFCILCSNRDWQIKGIRLGEPVTIRPNDPIPISQLAV